MNKNIAFDQQHIWHPYTNVVNPAPVFHVKSAHGVEITLSSGEKLIDGMSSWWSAIHGYNHPTLNKAVENQLKNMSHIMFGGLTHQPAIDLAKKLVRITADPLQHVFLVDSGSISVEVAIKMAIQYWSAQNMPNKKKLLAPKGGYHGDTLGTMAVCDPDNGMHKPFNNILTKHYFVDKPSCTNNVANITSLESTLKKHHSEIAAVIIEPLVQGASGMHIYCPDYLVRLRNLCNKFDVLLILDEIATGFGRTGTLFAYQQAKIIPDILCVGKALTGGYMTLAATITTKKIAHGLANNGDGTLMHGPTFMANPLACSVANASIELLLSSPWEKNVKRIEQQLKNELLHLKNNNKVNDVRVKGAIGIVELKKPIDLNIIQPKFVKLGVWIRPFGRLIYLMPPYIIDKVSLTKLTLAIEKILLDPKIN